MKTYYAYQKGSMEKFDSYKAFSRINAARHFAKKKQICLKDWLQINTVLEQEDFKMYYEKQIIFNMNNIEIIYEINKNSNYMVLKSSNTTEFTPSLLKFYKLKHFVNYMLKTKYSIRILDIPVNKNNQYYML